MRKNNNMDGEKEYIFFQPLDNIEVQKAIKDWLSEAGGSLNIDDIEKKFDEKFHFFYPQIYSLDQIRNETSPIESWEKFAFIIIDNKVYLNQP